MELVNRCYRTVLEQLEELMKDQQIIDSYEDYLENVSDGNETAAAVLVLASVIARVTIQSKGEVSKVEPEKK